MNNLYDGNVRTAWVENDVNDVGLGEKVRITCSRSVTITGFSVYAGYGKSKDIYKKNARVKDIELYIDGQKIHTFNLKDVMKTQSFTFKEPFVGTVAEFVISDVYKGDKYKDTCISELTLHWE